MPHQDRIHGHPKKSLSTVLSDFSLSLLVSLPLENSESIEKSTDSMSVAFTPRGTFRAWLWSSSESLVVSNRHVDA